MGLGDRLRRLVGRGAASAAGGCPADWRRPDGYWRCVRPAGHGGRHRMRATAREEVRSGPRRQAEPSLPTVEPGESDGAVAG